LWKRTAEDVDCIFKEINIKREKMIECANEKGFTNEDTIKFSQELDELIYRYQTNNHRPVKKREEIKSSIINMVMLLPKALASIVHSSY
jgi:stage 0 sporulation regulatory protein